MPGSDWLATVTAVFNSAVLLYFLILHTSYFLLLIIAYRHIRRYQRVVASERWRRIIQSPLTLPISILTPAYNEEQTIVDSVHSLLALAYPEHEVIVINDGSRDRTMEMLVEHFNLQPIPIQLDLVIACQPIQAIYRSPDYPTLVVIDKQNGGKGDALNAGINISRYPLICAIDADSVLEGDALLRVVRPFLEHPHDLIAVGGMIRVANGCRISHGKILEVGLPHSRLAMAQSVEYLRTFLFGRSGWSALGALLIISGAFGIFKRQILIEIGGYRNDTVGEDIELVVRMHRYLRERRIPYRIEFLPDPVCWTEVPESMRVLERQRNRWQRGLIDTIRFHHRMLLNPRFGVIGLVGMPFFVVFELLGPIFELLGYLFFPIGFYLGWLNLPFFLLFLLLSIVLGTTLSIVAVLLDEISFRRYPKVTQLLRLMIYGFAENIGYRQLTVWWRAKAFIDHWRGRRNWGQMERKGFTRPRRL